MLSTGGTISSPRHPYSAPLVMFTHPFIPLEGDPARLGAPAAQPVHHLVLEQRRVTKMFVNGVGGHLGDVLRRLGLDVERDEGVCHEVVNRLEPLLPDKVLPIVEQSVVEGLMPESGSRYKDKDVTEYRRRRGEQVE